MGVFCSLRVNDRRSVADRGKIEFARDDNHGKEVCPSEPDLARTATP